MPEERSSLECLDASCSSPEAWRRELVAFARRIGAGDEAEDLVQEAFLRSMSHAPRSHPRAWFYKVVLNVWRDRRRRSAPGSLGEQDLPADRSIDPAIRVERGNLAAVAWHVVSELPERQRLAVILKIQRYMDYDEISVALDCSVACARQHFHLGVKAVRDVLARSGHAH